MIALAVATQQKLSSMSNPVCQTVIVGGGFNGLFTALHLSHQHYPRSVILIEQNDRFCFKPLLYEYFSGEMEPDQVVPCYEELLKGSGVIFVQDRVQGIDLQQKQIEVASGDCYTYSNLVLALGSVTSYFGVEGAKENTLPFRTREDAIALNSHLRKCIHSALELEDPQERRRLMTVAIVGGGPTGVEVAATLADWLPKWYEGLGGNVDEVRVVLINHGEILEGDVNSSLRETAEKELKQRKVAVEIVLGVKVTTVHPDALEYDRDGKSEMPVGTVVWTAGTNTHPLIKSLPIPDENRDQHGRLHVTSTLQLPDFPEVFAGGDCAIELQSASANRDEYEHPQLQHDQSTSVEEHHRNAKPLPPTAQVAYQQGATIAHNLKALAMSEELKPTQVNLRGTLLKLGIGNSVANIFNSVEITGELGHLIRQGTYLELLPTPIHNFKATTEWLKDEVFQRYANNSVKQAAKVATIVGGVVAGAVVAQKLINALNNDQKDST